MAFIFIVSDNGSKRMTDTDMLRQATLSLHTVSVNHFYIPLPQQTLEALPIPIQEALKAQISTEELQESLVNATLSDEDTLEDVPTDVTAAPTVEPTTITPVDVRVTPALDPSTGRANATFVVLARNGDIDGIEASMRSIEEKFNSRHNYPWTFFNEEDFDEAFMSRVVKCTKAEVQFGKVKREWWDQPGWIDEDRAREGRERMASGETIPYAESVPYRNMCRYNSGVSVIFYLGQEDARLMMRSSSSETTC